MPSPINRRRFLSHTAAGFTGALASRFVSTGNAYAVEPDDRPFWEQYYSETMNIFTGLRDTQTKLIEQEMSTAYDRSKKGGKVYSQITSGHFPTEETALDRIGQPGVFGFLARGAKEDEYSKLGPNDTIITNTINLNNFEAMKRGIRVVAVTVNYYPFAKTPPKEGYQIEHEGKLLIIEDTANVTIDSQMPWYNGLVRAPQNPNFPVIPGGGMTQAVVYWMAAAEFAGVKSTKGISWGWADYYIERCIERAEMVGKDRPKYEAVGKKLAELVFAGARWMVFGANHALVSDACGVANGPMITRRYSADDVKKGDIVLIGAYSSNHPEEIAVAREARKKGAYVVAITPFSTDGDASGVRLYKEVDAAFNNYSPESWGIVPVDGLDRKVCPTTGVIGDLILWLIVSQWTDEMARRGEFPYFWKGFFMNGGREYNDSVRPFFSKRGW